MVTPTITRTIAAAASSWREQRAGEHRERGMSLTELLVSMGILVVMLPIAGGLLQTGVETQRDVQVITDAGTSAQLVVGSVEAGVRNASDLRRTTSGLNAADELLVARVWAGSASTPGWACEAWFYSAERGVLYTRKVPVTATTTSITTPTATTLEQWSVLAERVLPRSTAAGVLALTPDRNRVDLEFSVGTGTPRPGGAISTSIVRRPQGETRGAPCF